MIVSMESPSVTISELDRLSLKYRAICGIEESIPRSACKTTLQSFRWCVRWLAMIVSIESPSVAISELNCLSLTSVDVEFRFKDMSSCDGWACIVANIGGGQH